MKKLMAFLTGELLVSRLGLPRAGGQEEERVTEGDGGSSLSEE